MLIEQEKGDNLAPAGFVYSSVNDMMNYMRLLLHDGIFGKDTIITKIAIGKSLSLKYIFQYSARPFTMKSTPLRFWLVAHSKKWPQNNKQS